MKEATCTFASNLKDRITARFGSFHTAVILGSGLGDFAASLDDSMAIPYAEIPGFPIATAPGHAGVLFAGKIGSKTVLCLSGRKHFYEGAKPEDIVFPVRFLHLLGVEQLIVTNAAGGINTAFSAGEFMRITDHINFLPNPLIGVNDDSIGPRFPDMTYAYDPALGDIADNCASALNIPLWKGIYLGVTGPSFETPAEIRAFRTLGADAVGMSTVPEVIAANHCGMRVLGLSLISNPAVGVLERRLTSEEVIAAGDAASRDFGRLVTAILTEIA